jgi:two-component system cell cycle sensor histidine kinase/response regulator CckA
LDLNAPNATADLDESQFMQVVLNLAVNARDASRGGGEFYISSQNVDLGADFFNARDIKPQPGEYVLVTLRDNGLGIPAEALPRIFDPYFSTKSRDKGTGLGLSVVYGIIKQHNGFIFCSSEAGKGTTFQIYLPLSKNREDSAAISADVTEAVDQKRDNSVRHILIVEDEDSLRKLIAAQLAVLGYQVTTAENGRKALEFIDSYPGKIDLILSDIMMPEMNGLDMALEAQLMQPDTVFIFMSGYSKELLTSKNAPENYRLLAKPFSQEKLQAEIRSALG